MADTIFIVVVPFLVLMLVSPDSGEVRQTTIGLKRIKASCLVGTEKCIGWTRRHCWGCALKRRQEPVAVEDKLASLRLD
ncbi:hypothetical protein V1264_024482 [Littorina saxatilis]|uniref:Uncharacterized protein n=1 Tax=Littorina saxatilis TaxID=31220 RepID=A0AAN9G0R4_9CAEN